MMNRMTTRSMYRSMTSVVLANKTKDDMDMDMDAVKGLLMLKNEVLNEGVNCRYNLRSRNRKYNDVNENTVDYDTEYEYDEDNDTDNDVDSDYVVNEDVGFVESVSVSTTTRNRVQHHYKLRDLKKVDYSVFDAVSNDDADSDYEPEPEKENDFPAKIEDDSNNNTDTDMTYLREQFSSYRNAVDRNEKDIYMLNVYKHLSSNHKSLRQDTRFRDFVLEKTNTIISQYTTNPGMYRLEERPLIKDIMKNVYKVRDTILKLKQSRCLRG